MARTRPITSRELAALMAAPDPAVAPPRFGGIETVKRCVAAGLCLALLPTVTVAENSPTAGDRVTASPTTPPTATGVAIPCR